MLSSLCWSDPSFSTSGSPSSRSGLPTQFYQEAQVWIEGAGALPWKPYEVVSLDGLKKKANSVLPRRLEEKKKAQAEKDQLEPTSASVSLPIPDDGRAADQDAHADVSPEVENQPDTGQAVIQW